jgi:DNA polymerase-3 subunit epsilon
MRASDPPAQRAGPVRPDRKGDGLNKGRVSKYGVAAVVDIETTGLCVGTDEVIELALVLFRYDRRNGRIEEKMDAYSGLREPNCPISHGAYEVHHISRAVVRGRRLNYSRICAMLRKAEFVVAHNAEFDHGFLERLMKSFRTKTWLCSMRGINWKAKGLASRSLQDLAAAHHIKNPLPHRAGGDADTLMALLSYRRRCCRTRLSELLRNGRAHDSVM